MTIIRSIALFVAAAVLEIGGAWLVAYVPAQVAGAIGGTIADRTPKVLTTEAVQASDVVITMGCGDACLIFPGKRYLDWALDDPAGQGIDAVRPIRDEIEKRVKVLIAELTEPTERRRPGTT